MEPELRQLVTALVSCRQSMLDQKTLADLVRGEAMFPTAEAGG
jgi:hypothetical protein